MFDQVQDVLDGRKRHYRTKLVANASLPLRGFLICPECGKLLSGSASKGHTKHYSYYHCFAGCKFRHRADDTNTKFISELNQLNPQQAVLGAYKEVLLDVWNMENAGKSDHRKNLLRQVKEMEEKLSYIRELLSSKQIEPEDFRIMKADYSKQIDKLENQLSEDKGNQVDIKSMLDKGLAQLLKLNEVYEKGGIEERRRVISLIFPEKLRFENNLLRTNRLKVVRLIYLIDNKLYDNKKGQNGTNSILSSEVGMAARLSDHLND